MPSILRNPIPHSVLYPHKSIFSPSLCIFGFTCFVHDLTPRKDKLTARSIKYAFLGYTRLQKWYWYYSPEPFSGMNVTLHEHSPFSSANSVLHNVTKVLPIPYLDTTPSVFATKPF